jgi:hypothetical protein
VDGPSLPVVAAPAYLRWQFVRQRDLVSDLIAVGTAGVFSHVDIVLDDGALLGARTDAVGGAPPGVQIRPANYLASLWTHQVIIAVPCTTLQKGIADNFVHLQVGKEYDKLAIAGFVADRNWRSANEWFCSELGARYGEVAGVFAELFTPDNKVAPNALALVCSAVPGRVISIIK